MFRKIKHAIATAAIGAAGFFGYHYHVTPPTMSVDPIVHVAPTGTPFPSPTPQWGYKFPKMMLTEIRGVDSDEERDMVKRAIEDANTVMQSDCFKARVLAAVFTENRGMSSQKIWDLLASKPINVGVEMYDGSWKENYWYKTMGYDVGDGFVYANRYFVDDSLILMSLAAHEAEGHGQGFRHDFEKSTSVPYQLNDMIEACAAVIGLKKFSSITGTALWWVGIQIKDNNIASVQALAQ